MRLSVSLSELMAALEFLKRQSRLEKLILHKNKQSIKQQINKLLSILYGKYSQAVRYTEFNTLNSLGMAEEG